MSLLIGLAIRPAVILAFGLLLGACLAKRSAALRHRVLAASLLASVLVIPFSVALPEWRVTLRSPASLADQAGPALTVATGLPVAPPSTAPRGSASSIATSSTPFVATVVVTVWLTGVAFFASGLLTGLFRIRRLAARATRVSDERWMGILARVSAGYGLRREIVLARTGSAELLATWGVLRPRVLLPHNAMDWSLDRVRVVLCHELAHVRRHDWLVQIGAEIVRATLWFNPLVLIVCRRLRRESEQACDDEVLASGVGGRDYASHLIELARQFRRPGSSRAPVMMPMAHPSTLERRIIAMLNPRLDRNVPSIRVLGALAVVLLLVTLPVASLRARQAGPAPLSGTVYDVSGAVMPGVAVKLVDANQTELTATTEASGRFEFPPVGPGKYVLEATLPGFRTLRHELLLKDSPDWNRAITLQVGELQETITVRGPKQAMARTEPSGQVRVGGNVRAPRKIKDVRPTFPPSMSEAGLTGVVPLEAVIGRDGTVSSVRVMSAQAHPDFANAAIDAVRQWRFTPTLLNGQAVEVLMRVNVTFDSN